MNLKINIEAQFDRSGDKFLNETECTLQKTEGYINCISLFVGSEEYMFDADELRDAVNLLRGDSK